MNPGTAALELERIAKDLKTNIGKAEQATLKEGIDIARNYSSGPFSQHDLEQMGHPFSAVRPGTINADQINVFTGSFRGGWIGVDRGWDSGNKSSQILNDSRVAQFLLEGTQKMIARPIGAAIEQMLEPIRQRNLIQAIDRACR